MKIIIKLLIVALIANATWRLGMEYATHYRFSDSVQDGVIPPISFGVLRTLKRALPGSIRSGAKTRK